MIETLLATGTLSIIHFDGSGAIKDQRELKNLIVNGGLAYLTARIMNGGGAAISHMALGTSNTVAAATDTTLGAEIGRVALGSSTQVTTNITSDSVQFVATFGPGVCTGALTEAGLFNAVSNGTMLNRTVFGVINKAASDSIVITWKLVVNA